MIALGIILYLIALTISGAICWFWWRADRDDW
jgi:hypothetical protein